MVDSPQMQIIIPRSSRIILSLLLVLTVHVHAQVRYHDLGSLKFRIDTEEYCADEESPSGIWPQDYFRYDNFTMWTMATAVGNYTDSQGNIQIKVVHSKHGRNSDTVTLTEYRRSTPPTVMVMEDGEWQQSSITYTGEIDQNLISDVMVELTYKAWPGFKVSKQTYSYSNPNHGNYIIFHNKFVCTFDYDEDPWAEIDSSQTLQGVYFMISYQCQPSLEGTYITYSKYTGNGSDDWADWATYPSQLVNDNRPLEVSFGWDGDNTDITSFESGSTIPFDDTGDPRFAMGETGGSAMASAEFVSSAYAGFASLYASESAQNNVDDPRQPTGIISHTEIHNVWYHNIPGYVSEYDWMAAHSRTGVEAQAGWPADPGFVKGEMPYQSFGPYDFQLGDSIEFVYAIAVDGISRKISEDAGRDWLAWYRGEAGASFDDVAKNDLIATGADSLFKSLDRAYWAWDRGLDIPDPPRSPHLWVRPGANRVYLEWEDLGTAKDADTDVPDLESYRVYRKKGGFLNDNYDDLREDGSHLRWEMIAEVPKSQITYQDTNVIRGEGYHYGVTAVDDGTQNTDGLYPGQKLESSLYANRSEIAAIPFSAPDLSKPVRVIPNPYIAHGGDFNYTDNDNRLLFINVPPICTIRIFTVTGDLIKTIDHASESGDERWDQITETNQQIASGVYVLQVDNGTDADGIPVAGSMAKFVIVR